MQKRLGVDASMARRLVPIFLGQSFELGAIEIRVGNLAHTEALGMHGGDPALVSADALGAVGVHFKPAFVRRVDRRRCTDVGLAPAQAVGRSEIEELLSQRLALPPGVVMTLVTEP